MPPTDYVRSRLTREEEFFATVVDGRPYLPNLVVDATRSESSVVETALSIVMHSIRVAESTNSPDLGRGATKANSNAKEVRDDLPSIFSPPINRSSVSCLHSVSALTCTRVTGGITNALYRVGGFGTLRRTLEQLERDDASLIDFDSVLVRVFGAEGMIDRDVETSTYSALCDAGIAYRHLGRFGNGRVEGWLDGYVPLKSAELADGSFSLEIASALANMHCSFHVPEGELREHHGVVGLWDQLSGWMNQAKGYVDFKTPSDTERVRKLELDMIEVEVANFISSFAGDGDGESANGKQRIVFSHNDLLAANIMRHLETGKIQLIDFEYGGTNYAAFDIANHWNEHAGGTSAEENGLADYTRFPSPERQMDFCLHYVRTSRELTMGAAAEADAEADDDADDECSLRAEASDLLDEVRKFLLVNHLYWGLWAVNQAAEEGCDEFDYINFATSRFGEFRAKKAAAREGA